MKQIAKEDKLILLGLVGLSAVYYFGILNPILKSLGIKKSADEKKAEEDRKKQIESEIKANQKKSKQTKTDTEWQTIADQIYEDLRYSAIDDNKADAGYQVTRVKNETDFWILYKLFGKRQEYLFGIPAGSKMDLQQFITSNLSKKAIAQINDNYRRKNIKYRF